MMYAGPRRPDWTRTGTPAPRELDAMMQWRDGVLRGWPSLASADVHVNAGALARGRTAAPSGPTKGTSLRAAIGAPDAIPRPPGVGADHYLVKDGVLA